MHKLSNKKGGLSSLLHQIPIIKYGCHLLLKRLQCYLIVGLVRYSLNQLSVNHPAILINHYHCPCHQPLQRTVGQAKPVTFHKVVTTEQREWHNIVQPLGSAEARLCKRQIHRQAEHDSIFKFRGTSIELTDRQGTCRCVETRENIQYQTLAPIGRQADFLQRSVHSPEIRCFLPHLYHWPTSMCLHSATDNHFSSLSYRTFTLRSRLQRHQAQRQNGAQAQHRFYSIHITKQFFSIQQTHTTFGCISCKNCLSLFHTKTQTR